MQDFDPIATLSGNTKLTFASTFHSLHAIAAQIAPVLESGGIETLETDKFQIHCHETHTGMLIDGIDIKPLLSSEF